MTLVRRIVPRRLIDRRPFLRGVTPRRPWRQVGLVWRKASLRTLRRPSRAPKLLVSTIWSPRFTLNLSFSALFPRSAIGVWQLFPISSVIWRQLSSRQVSVRPLLRALRETRSRNLIDRVDRVATNRTQSLREAIALEIRRTMAFGDAPRTSAMGASLDAVAHGFRCRKISVRPAPAPIASVLAYSWRRPARMSFANPRTGASAVSERPAAHSPTRFRAPELVWRTEIETAVAKAHERQIASVPPPASIPSAASVNQADNPATALPAIGQRLLDPSLMDRVAEDVIGRIERRIRIERERRGL